MFTPREWLERTRYMQLIASISVTFSVAVTGMFLSWSSPAIPLLTGEKEGLDFKITTEQASWVASGYVLGTAIGNAIVGIPTEKLGRRMTLLMGAPLYFICWIGIIFSKDFYTLLLSRLIGGIGSSTAFVCCSLYIGEIADKDLRGRLASAMSVLKLSGNLYVLSVGPFMSYYALAWSCSVIPVILFLSLLPMPESSYYHLKKGNLDKARDSLVWFSAKNTTKQQIEEKLESIKDGVDKDMRNKSSFTELFTSRIHRKAVIAVIGLKILQQFCGIAAIESYMQTIIHQSGSSLSEDLSSVIFGIVQFVGALCSASLIDHFGRKPLLFISAVGCAVSLTAEGIYFYLTDALNLEVNYLSWLPTTGLTIYLFLSSAGIYTIPYIYMGEIFATNIKETAGGFSTFFGACLSFTVTKSYSPLKEAFGIYTVFWIFAVICFCGSVFVAVAVPETKNKSLKDIQAKLNKNLPVKDEDIVEEGGLKEKQVDLQKEK